MGEWRLCHLVCILPNGEPRKVVYGQCDHLREKQAP